MPFVFSRDADMDLRMIASLSALAGWLAREDAQRLVIYELATVHEREYRPSADATARVSIQVFAPVPDVIRFADATLRTGQRPDLKPRTDALMREIAGRIQRGRNRWVISDRYLDSCTPRELRILPRRTISRWWPIDIDWRRGL